MPLTGLLRLSSAAALIACLAGCGGSGPPRTVEETATTEAEAAEIRGLIKDLAKVDGPDVGYMPSAVGENFAPVASSARFRGGLLMTDHGLKPSDAFRRLVEFGPEALPFLLESLDADTPSKYSVGDKPLMMMSMWARGWMPTNPGNKREQEATKAAVRTTDWGGRYFEVRDLANLKWLDTYTVRAGDLCFVAIGQITNRNYAAVHYVPTACLEVSSPVLCAELCDAVRAIWGEGPHRQDLYDSLLFDFRGGFDQRNAVMRLLYYYPKETSSLAAEWVRLPEHQTVEDINAVSFTQEPRVRRQLYKIFRESMDLDVALACLPGIDAKHDRAVLRRLRQFADLLPPEPESWQDPWQYGHWQDFRLLQAIGDRSAEEAATVYRDYLTNGSSGCRFIMCYVLRMTRGELAAELLLPVLDDKTLSGNKFYADPDRREGELAGRISDEAAFTISMHDKDLEFEMAGTHADLDRQIEAMKKHLTK